MALVLWATCITGRAVVVIVPVPEVERNICDGAAQPCMIGAGSKVAVYLVGGVTMACHVSLGALRAGCITRQETVRCSALLWRAIQGY